MNKLVEIGLIALLIAPAIHAQQPDLSDEEHIKLTLAQSQPEERKKLLKDLGVDAEDTEKYKDLSISMAGGLEWHRLRGQKIQTAVLFMPCQDEGSSSLYLLEKKIGRWVVVDATGFDCHYNSDVSVELANLTSNQIDDLLVRNDCESHGTGYVEHHYQVFFAVNGKLKKEFEATDKLYVDGWPGAGNRDQKSLVIPVFSRIGHAQNLEETRITVLNKQRTVSRRYIYWAASQHKFLATKFMKVTGPK